MISIFGGRSANLRLASFIGKYRFKGRSINIFINEPYHEPPLVIANVCPFISLSLPLTMIPFSPERLTGPAKIRQVTAQQSSIPHQPYCSFRHTFSLSVGPISPHYSCPAPTPPRSAMAPAVECRPSPTVRNDAAPAVWRHSEPTRADQPGSKAGNYSSPSRTGRRGLP